MPQLRSESQRPRTAPASQGAAPSSLDLGTLHQALPSSRTPLVVHQNRRNIGAPSPRQQLNGKQVSRPASLLPRTSRSTGSSESNKMTSTLKRPTTAESTTSASAASSPAEGRKKGSSNLPRSRLHDVGRKNLSTSSKIQEVESIPSVNKLPPDLLCQCFTSIESLYYLVNCASVCRAWRDTLLSDTVWKPIYLRWWHLMEGDDSFEGQPTEANQLPVNTRNPPEGYETWRNAFIGNFQRGRQRLLIQERATAVAAGYLHPRRVTDRNGKRVIDCGQGEAMRKLSGHLGLSFHVTINRGRPVRLQGKGKVEMFDSACILRYPVAGIGSLSLSGLKSVEVTVTSDKLLRVCPVLEHVSINSPYYEVGKVRK
ncbi:hypothetical protein R1sor_021065 [Riccia sorocarpa]|uniref:F-box domain-containing protein n=1 Tax=Riccia sorocarpa TaxID=122646 RepID=A0ABD3GLP2_9MARC